MRNANEQSELGDRLRRFSRWLMARPLESWGFFAAGFVIARLLF